MWVSIARAQKRRGFTNFKSLFSNLIRCAWCAIRNTFMVVVVARRYALLTNLEGFQRCWSFMSAEAKLEFVSSHSGKAMLSNYDFAVYLYDLNYGLPSTFGPHSHSMRLAIARTQGEQARVDAVDEYVQYVSEHLLRQ